MTLQQFLKRLPLTACAALAVAAAAQQTSAPADPAPGAHVIFSRSESDNPGAQDRNADAALASKIPVTPTIPVSNEERRAITFLSYDLEVHLRPREQAIEVRSRMTIRNDGAAPLNEVPLQISSTLRWTSVRAGEKPASFRQQMVASDADHTGKLTEAVIALPQPLAPGATLALDAIYSGTAPLSSDRLQALGTPPAVAQSSDWDRVSEEFVGLRGFGDIVWYPVASVPAALGDGNKLFAEVAEQRGRGMQTVVSIELTEEFFHSPPNLAVLDGKLFKLSPESLPSSASLPGIVKANLPPTPLGFTPLSLFLTERSESDGSGLKVFARPEDTADAATFMAAAGSDAPLITRWLGAGASQTLAIIDLPEPEDASFEDGGVLFTDLRNADPEKLAPVLAHGLAHAHFRSPYPWLEEGTALFMETLWLEQARGRDAALNELESQRGALSLIEPDGTSGKGESLCAAKDAVYYRTKAAYVLWMLRDLAGDDALARAFQNYRPAADSSGHQFEQMLEAASGKDLKWFFDDWVYQDRGLPDLSIAGVYPSASAAPGSYIVAVNVVNRGSAEADVPISVRSDATTVTERLLIPAQSKVTHRFLIQGQPEQVTVNDGTIPEAEETTHTLDLRVSLP